MSDEAKSISERRSELVPQEREIGSVIRDVAHPELAPSVRESWRDYLLSLLLVGIAGLVVLCQYAQRPPKPVPGPETLTLPAPDRAQGALNLIAEADKIFKEAKGRWNDDEAQIKVALSKNLEAWKLLHGGAEFPNGELIYDSARCGEARRNLLNTIPDWKDDADVK